MKEIETRSPIKNRQEIVAVLEAQGFVAQAPYEQHDIMFDRPDGSLFISGQKIRFRMENGKGELTYKGHMEGSDTTSRRIEINISVDPNATNNIALLFGAIGYPLLFQVKKLRETFVNSDGIKATIDHWPIIGLVLELEGDEEAIAETAGNFAQLHFKNYRLKELIRLAESDSGLTLAQLKAQHLESTGFDVGRIELLAS